MEIARLDTCLREGNLNCCDIFDRDHVAHQRLSLGPELGLLVSSATALASSHSAASPGPLDMDQITIVGKVLLQTVGAFVIRLHIPPKPSHVR